MDKHRSKVYREFRFKPYQPSGVSGSGTHTGVSPNDDPITSVTSGRAIQLSNTVHISYTSAVWEKKCTFLHLSGHTHVGSRIIRCYKNIGLPSSRQPHSDGNAEYFWQREKEVTAGLNHPNITCRTGAYEIKESSKPIWCLRYEHGGSPLPQYLNVGRISLKHELGCFLQGIKGLAYLHRQGIIHRDFKPSNLVISSATPLEDATVKIVDYELTIKEEPDGPHPYTGGVGTHIYMAPEVEDYQPYDSRADVYSAGITLRTPLYHSPLARSNPGQLALITTQKGKDANARSLIYLINRMTQKDPKKRPFLKGLIEPLERAIDKLHL